MGRDDYMSTVGRIQKRHFERLLDFIKECPGFENLSKSSIARLLLMWKYKTFYKNQVIFRQGQKIPNLYLVMSGEFILTQKDSFEKDDSDLINDNFRQKQCIKSNLSKALLVKNHSKLSTNLMTACKGSVIGLIDKILFDSYSSTCICKTVQATAFEID